MVEITKIECQKNKNKFNLFVDGQFYSGVLKETAIANNFFVGKKISPEMLNQIIIESDSKQAFNKASDYLATRLHTKFELKGKLLKKGYNLQAIDLALQKLEEYGYLNDANFVQIYVQSQSGLSKQLLTNKLLSKGIDKNIIYNVLSTLDTNQELNNAIRQTEKYLKNKNYLDVKDKLYAHLIRKGFKHDIINKAIKQVTNNDIDWE